MLKLPDWTWFFNKQGNYVTTNTYTGSLETDLKNGCTNRTTFEYRVFVSHEDGAAVATCAECAWKTPWNQGGEELCRFTEEFSGDAAGIENAKVWVEEKFASTNPNG